jgi:predicted phage terminase large subunit-like protein
MPTHGDPFVRATEALCRMLEPERAAPHAECDLSLRAYLEAMWSIVEPETPFVPGWHLDAICEHLTVPPRHTKSLCTSVAWPTWAWTRWPELRFLYASYSGSLSTEHAVLSRRVINSHWYQERWGGLFDLTTDQDVKTHYENTRRGYRISTSVGGTVTGHGGDFIVCDDPHNLEEIYSETVRRGVIKWYRQVWSSRLNDPKRGCRVVIMQRGHEQDLAGELIEAGYEHLNLPTEYEPTERRTLIGWADPRTAPGDLLCPARFGPEEVAAAKSNMGSQAYAAQHQQRPVPEGGGMFKREWFKIVEAAPIKAARCRFWDCAGSEAAAGSDPDWAVGTREARDDDGLYYIEDVERVRMLAGALDTLIWQTALLDGVEVRVREEQEPGSSGKAVIESRTKRLAGFDYAGVRSTGEKSIRWRPLAVQAEAGNVRLVRGAWIKAWLDEICAVPFASHDDQADSASGAFSELALNGAPAMSVKEVLGMNPGRGGGPSADRPRSSDSSLGDVLREAF